LAEGAQLTPSKIGVPERFFRESDHRPSNRLRSLCRHKNVINACDDAAQVNL
jgi:hypothetical protein